MWMTAPNLAEVPVLWTELTTVSSDPLVSVRVGLGRAEDQLRAGDWTDAEETLREALAALASARSSTASAPFARGGLTPNQQRRVVRHVEERLGGPITLVEMAGVAGLSPSHFCRVFRACFGMPPLHYVQRRRVERAMELMLATEDSLAAIALECGLYDQAALCKVFRRVTGQTPAAWRRRRRA